MKNVMAICREWLNLIIQVVRQFRQGNYFGESAAMTYATLFAMVPLMTVSYAILAAVPALKEVGGDIQAYLFQHFVPASGHQIQSYLQSFSEQATNLTAVGGGMLFVTVLFMLVKIENLFNRIWRVPVGRKGVMSFLLYWAVLSLGPLLFGMAMAISSYLLSQELFHEAAALFGGAQQLLKLLPPLLTWLAFTLLYVTIPNCRVPFAKGVLGALIASLLFEIAKRGFAFYVTAFPSYQLVYGAFAVVPLFLLWLYVSWVIVLFGGVFVHEYTVYQPGFHKRAQPLLGFIGVLRAMDAAFEAGHVFEGTAIKRKELGVDVETWETAKRILEQNNYIRRLESGGYVLSRSLGSITLWDIYQMAPWKLNPMGHGELIPAGLDVERVIELVGNPYERLKEVWHQPVTSLWANGAEVRFISPDEQVPGAT